MNNLNKTKKTLVIIVSIIVIVIIGYYVYGRELTTEEVLKDEEILVKEETQKQEGEGKIVVHITGAINKEGIVTLEENSRVADAIEAAGGLKDDADMSKINLAYILEDGVKIKIPSINEKDETNETENVTDGGEFVEILPEENSKSGTNTININKASQTELETLPGIGPSIALKIINYRNENGKFSSIEDLKKVNGVGDNKYENIKDLICVK